ncbi:integrator complex subunit 6-like [Cervus elaphus]|uniref:integrator complex subunit 6-like n=1 Tax=Cervus elaphus TaxID=9860 RepID=UPI001CC30AC0|nr:integrator complex subunit 6-like [Cervus elaphus]XP_043753620.1 integrator complex subunit 6-like [Cervus elaphus]XP_043753621.1 integrator complex subunit 6-like [Cervus elaphus]
MKDDEAVQFTAGHQKQMKHPGEPKGHSSSKRRQIATVTHDVDEKKMENSQTPPGGFFSKSASPGLMNMAGDGIPLNQVDSLSDDFTRLKKDGQIHEPGDNALIGGTKNCSVSAGDSKATAMSSKGTVPNKSQMSPVMAQKINDDIKYQLMKEVQKSGRNFERIFTLLEEVQGPLAVKKQFVEFTMKEAARFKRVVLIQQLEKVLEKVESNHLSKKS